MKTFMARRMGIIFSPGSAPLAHAESHRARRGVAGALISRVLVQLNRGEGRHGVARVVHFGKRGELRQRYKEGQEDQLGALGLVVNAIVLWNTRYMEAALTELRTGGRTIEEEDVRRLSPLVHSHLNFLGRYPFSLPSDVRHGDLRDLRDPNAGLEEELLPHEGGS